MGTRPGSLWDGLKKKKNALGARRRPREASYAVEVAAERAER